MNVITPAEIDEFLQWQALKGQLKFNEPITHGFPIIYNCIYWVHLGCNIGSEQGKKRPAIITRNSQSSPMCTIIPLTTKRLEDKYYYHIDLEHHDSTALVEQMRTIDKRRIDEPMRIGGKFASISQKDWNRINEQIQSNFLLRPLPQNKE